jgi:hypothetical protein
LDHRLGIPAAQASHIMRKIEEYLWVFERGVLYLAIRRRKRQMDYLLSLLSNEGCWIEMEGMNVNMCLQSGEGRRDLAFEIRTRGPGKN